MAKLTTSETARTRVTLESVPGVYVKGPKTWELYRTHSGVESSGLEEFSRYATPIEVELLQALVEKGRAG